jgi:HAD superfamily hydrolase (TIGR01548 family)
VSAGKDLLIFDMDGVLVDVTDSYRAAIQATVKHFTGYEPSNREIQDWKNQGGWNDDWLLSTEMVRARGGNQTYAEVKDYFQKIFLGKGSDGLILRERWLAADGLFDRLCARHHLTVFTGRTNWEARLTLDRFMPSRFHSVVGSDDVLKHKPDPEGLHKICSAIGHGKCWYIGDTVDDARASRAANIPFVGIASRANPRYEELVKLLNDEGAIAILDDINSLEEVVG